MSNFKKNLDNIKTARVQKSPAEPKVNPAEPMPYALTTIEKPEALDALQKAAHETFQPENPLIAALADQIAEDTWSRQRLGAIHHQSLSFDIEKNHDALIAQYPNADASMHTIQAWKDNQGDKALRRAFTDQTPLTNRVIRLMTFLERRSRRRS